MKFIAHRGESSEASENTIEAFVLALSYGCDGIEGDFRMLRDGSIVCFHDEFCEKLGMPDRKVSELSLKELRDTSVSIEGLEQWSCCKVPTLSEVLDTVIQGKYFFLEVKCGVEIVPSLVNIIKEAPICLECLKIISFHKEVLKELSLVMPELQTSLIVCLDMKNGVVFPGSVELCSILNECGASGVSCCAHDFLTEDYIKDVKSAGYEFNVWTIDDSEKARGFIDMGVDSITSNRVHALCGELEGI